jgi:hypothetical protein
VQAVDNKYLVAEKKENKEEYLFASGYLLCK